MGSVFSSAFAEAQLDSGVESRLPEGQLLLLGPFLLPLHIALGVEMSLSASCRKAWFRGESDQTMVILTSSVA